jgi:hypothetical protein
MIFLGFTEMSFSERDLGKAFKSELEKGKFILKDQGYGQKEYATSFKVYLNKQVHTERMKFKQFWQRQNLDTKDIPPPQPEIDMILIDDFDIVRAVEIKWIKVTKKGIRPSYYEGLDQALAYLSFGFHQVALWCCFDGNALTDKEIDEYYDAFNKIRTPIRWFVDSTYFKIGGSREQPRIETEVFTPSSRRWQLGIGIPHGTTHSITWQSFNPFLRQVYSPTGEIWVIKPEIRRQIEVIHQFLKEQMKMWNRATTSSAMHYA